MSERPTLTIAVPCPRCEGTRIQCFDDKMTYIGPRPCPDCTDGTIRQAVSCQSCRWYLDGLCDELCVVTELQNYYPSVDPDFGCLSWEAKEGA